MSQAHEHPTQSIAPGAEAEQAGDNPAPQWVNPAAAAAAEFAPRPANPRRGSETADDGPETTDQPPPGCRSTTP